MVQTPEEQKASRQKHYLKHHEELLAYKRDYRSKNLEKLKSAERKYRLEHKDVRNEYSREYRMKNPERLITNDKAYRKKNREKINAYTREYRARDTEAVRVWKARDKVRKRKYFLEHRDHVQSLEKGRTAWFYDLKRTLKCAVCGQSFPDCPDIIDFHHIKGKESAKNRIGSMVTGKEPKARILVEVEKCIPLCANCHRKVHYLARQRKKGKGLVPAPKPSD
jgi:hypothetical protein